MRDLEKRINAKIEKLIEDAVMNKIFPAFQKETKYFLNENFYNMYTPLVYNRQYRLLTEWDIKKTKSGEYEIFIKENVKGEWQHKIYYLPYLIENGYVTRKIRGKYQYIPYPLTSRVRSNLRGNEYFMKLLKQNGLYLS